MPSLSLGQIFQSGVLIVVFFLANHYYAKVHDVRNKQVEIRIDVARKVSDAVQEVHAAFAKCTDCDSIPASLSVDLNRSLRSYSNAVKMLGDAVGDLDVLESPSFEVLREDRKKYKDLLTSDPYPNTISFERVNDESNMYDKLQSNLTLFRLALAGSR